MFDSMTSEDFFTLTEMKNGLTTLARVEELICVMQNQKACATSNVSDAARQWTTVATTLASTENQDCLSHFVHLNGLCFLNQWLQEAVKCTQEAADASELINLLFGSLEKLPVDMEKLNDSGILLTVEKLFSHKTADIKLRAQTLFARWNTERINDDCCQGNTERINDDCCQGNTERINADCCQGNTERINDDCCQDMEEGCLNLVESSKPSADATSVQDKHGEDKNADSSPCQTAVEEGSCRNESDRIGKLRAKSPNSPHSNNTDDGLKGSIPHQTMKMNSSSEEKEKSALIPIPALDSTSFEEKLSVDETSVALVGMESFSAPVSPKVPVKDDDECSTSDTKDQNEIDAKMNTWIGNSYDLGQRDSFCVSSGRSATSPEEKPILVCSASAMMILLESKGAVNLSDDDGILLRQESIGAANEDNFPLNEPTLKECNADPSKISEYKVTEELNTNMDLANDQKACFMTEKIKYDFDLNVEVFSEDFESAMNHIQNDPDSLFVPIYDPCNIEGDMDCRDSAATSAFCPASLPRAQDSGKRNSGSKSKENLVEIDLNVAESVGDMAVDPALVTEFPVFHSIPSRDSSVEVSSGEPARIQLDLNSTGYEDAPFLQSSILSHRPEKRRRTSSPTSSSSIYPSQRNFDLNDSLMHDSNSSFIIIMGKKMPVKRTDDTNQAYQNYLGSGLSWDDFGSGTTLIPCPQQVLPPGFGYNGMGMDPSFPFQPFFYSNSNTPLMAEARSTPIIPHLFGPSYPHGAPLSSQPILTSITTTPSSSNGVESSNPGLDLNSSTIQMESGDGEARSLYDFFVPAPTNPSEELTRSPSQASSSRLLPLKRKEPASGWDSFGFSYNRATIRH